MTLPLQVLGVLSVVGGLIIGFPGQLFKLEGWSLIDSFLHPLILQVGGHGAHGEAVAEHGAHAVSFGLEWFLVLLSVAVAVSGILVARRFYKLDPELSIPRRLAERFAFAYKLVYNKYFVDEAYHATAIKGTIGSARLLWEFDARVVDGAVNGARHATVGSSFLSGIFDLRVVDGLVNLVGWICHVGSYYFRRLQVGFTQAYATVMVLGAALLLVFYLIF